MINGKVKIIITTVLLFFVIFIIIFKITDKLEKGDIINIDSILKTGENDHITTEKKIDQNTLQDLKYSHPEYDAKQLEFFAGAASKNSMESCEGRNDQNDCISAVAFLTGNYYFCGEVDDQNKSKCSDEILVKSAPILIDACNATGTEDNKIYCYVNLIISVYNKPEDCINIKNEKMQKICEGVLYYQMAIQQNNIELCDKIKEEFINNYCVKHIVVDKFQDFDRDGLSDQQEVKNGTDPNSRDSDYDGLTDKKEIEYLTNPLIADSDKDSLIDEEEVLKYRSDPNNKDSDGDGISDGIEVENGYSPIGPGKL